MKFGKKILPFLLTLLIFISTLTGCVPSGDVGNVESGSSEDYFTEESEGSGSSDTVSEGEESEVTSESPETGDGVFTVLLFAIPLSLICIKSCTGKKRYAR